jgi:hypothetical protein
MLPEHFPEKACPGLDPGWILVFRRKCDQLKKLERVSDIETRSGAIRRRAGVDEPRNYP